MLNSQDVTKRSVLYALLGLLSGKPAHGYELFSRFHSENGLGFVYNVKKSLLYAYLQQLDEQGFILVNKQWNSDERAKKVFSISETGQEVFEIWLDTPVEHVRDLRNEFLLKVFFLEAGLPERKGSLFGKQRKICEQWLAKNEAVSVGNRFANIVQDYRKNHIQAILSWLNMELGEVE